MAEEASQRLGIQSADMQTERSRKEIIAQLELQDRQPKKWPVFVAMVTARLFSFTTLILGLVCLLGQSPMWTCVWTASGEAVECGSREWAYWGNEPSNRTSYDSWTEACIYCPTSDAQVRRWWVPRNQAGFAFVLLGLIANFALTAALNWKFMRYCFISNETKNHGYD